MKSQDKILHQLYESNSLPVNEAEQIQLRRPSFNTKRPIEDENELYDSSDDGSIHRENRISSKRSEMSYMSKASKCSKFSQESTIIIRQQSEPIKVDFQDFQVSLQYVLDNLDKIIALKNSHNKVIFKQKLGEIQKAQEPNKNKLNRHKFQSGSLKNKSSLDAARFDDDCQSSAASLLVGSPLEQVNQNNQSRNHCSSPHSFLQKFNTTPMQEIFKVQLDDSLDGDLRLAQIDNEDEMVLSINEQQSSEQRQQQNQKNELSGSFLSIGRSENEDEDDSFESMQRVEDLSEREISINGKAISKSIENHLAKRI